MAGEDSRTQVLASLSVNAASCCEVLLRPDSVTPLLAAALVSAGGQERRGRQYR